MADNADLINRIVAVVIDHVLIWVIMLLLALPMGLQAAAFGMMGTTDILTNIAMLSSMIVYGLISLLVWIGYFTYFEANGGQTVGKKIVNIKVVKENGKPMTYIDAFVRTILRIIDVLPAFYIIGLILIVASKDDQRLGDMAAKTLVVKA